MTMLLEAIDNNEVTKYSDLEDLTGVKESSIKQYANDESRLEACIEKTDGEYRLTPVGKKALKISWGAVFADLD